MLLLIHFQHRNAAETRSLWYSPNSSPILALCILVVSRNAWWKQTHLNLQVILQMASFPKAQKFLRQAGLLCPDSVAIHFENMLTTIFEVSCKFHFCLFGCVMIPHGFALILLHAFVCFGALCFQSEIVILLSLWVIHASGKKLKL